MHGEDSRARFRLSIQVRYTCNILHGTTHSLLSFHLWFLKMEIMSIEISWFMINLNTITSQPMRCVTSCLAISFGPNTTQVMPLSMKPQHLSRPCPKTVLCNSNSSTSLIFCLRPPSIMGIGDSTICTAALLHGWLLNLILLSIEHDTCNLLEIGTLVLCLAHEIDILAI